MEPQLFVEVVAITKMIMKKTKKELLEFIFHKKAVFFVSIFVLTIVLIIGINNIYEYKREGWKYTFSTIGTILVGLLLLVSLFGFIGKKRKVK